MIRQFDVYVHRSGRDTVAAKAVGIGDSTVLINGSDEVTVIEPFDAREAAVKRNATQEAVEAYVKSTGGSHVEIPRQNKETPRGRRRGPRSGHMKGHEVFQMIKRMNGATHKELWKAIEEYLGKSVSEKSVYSHLSSLARSGKIRRTDRKRGYSHVYVAIPGATMAVR